MLSPNAHTTRIELGHVVYNLPIIDFKKKSSRVTPCYVSGAFPLRAMCESLRIVSQNLEVRADHLT